MSGTVSMVAETITRAIGETQKAGDQVAELGLPVVERRQITAPLHSAIEHLRAAQRRLPADR